MRPKSLSLSGTCLIFSSPEFKLTASKLKRAFLNFLKLFMRLVLRKSKKKKKKKVEVISRLHLFLSTFAEQKKKSSFAYFSLSFSANVHLSFQAQTRSCHLCSPVTLVFRKKNKLFLVEVRFYTLKTLQMSGMFPVDQSRFEIGYQLPYDFRV